MEKLLIFDLDGTLMDSQEGIISSLRYASDFFGLEPKSDECLRKLIGPSMREIFIKKRKILLYHCWSRGFCHES